jgi:hypothetical protein
MAKAVCNWQDLVPLGIECLTGEACGLGLRILCDVNEDGLSLVRACLGAVEVKPAENWSGGRIEGKRKVGALMLPYDLFGTLAVFGLLRAGARQVVKVGGTYTPILTDQDAEMAELCERHARERGEHVRRFGRSTHPGTGFRNTHQMSGRTE